MSIDDHAEQVVDPHTKTEVLYTVQCPGYKSSTYVAEPHTWLKTGPVHPRSSYMCEDCMKAWRKQY